MKDHQAIAYRMAVLQFHWSHGHGSILSHWQFDTLSSSSNRHGIDCSYTTTTAYLLLCLVSLVCVSASSRRRARVGSMVAKACSLFWYPFTQHRGLAHEDVAIVDSASGDAYSLEGANGQRTQLFDAAASWWTQVPHTCHAIQT